MAFSPEVMRLVRAHWEAMGNPLIDPGSDKGMLEMLDEQRADETLAIVVSSIPFALDGRRLLEIGCGVGATLAAASRRGAQAYGIEPGPGVGAANLLLAEQGYPTGAVVQGVGEAIPFPDCAFDVVCSFQVLEHTHEPAAVLSETVRVLKPGGYFVHVFPNYGSFWEGHYGIVWPPHLPKALARVYLRLLRRDRTMLEQLQLLSHERVARLLKDHPNIQIKSWGFALWEHRMRSLDFSEWAYLGRAKRMVRWLHRLHLVDLAVVAGRALHLETPIVLVGTKVAHERS